MSNNAPSSSPPFDCLISSAEASGAALAVPRVTRRALSSLLLGSALAGMGVDAAPASAAVNSSRSDAAAMRDVQAAFMGAGAGAESATPCNTPFRG